MMKGGYSNYPYSPATVTSMGISDTNVPTFSNQMQLLDSPAMKDTTALDYSRINPSVMSAAQSGANAMQSGGTNRKQHGGVWNQMIGDAIAPLVLLGLQQYYGPRSKSRMHKKSYKGRMTKKYRNLSGGCTPFVDCPV
jgi:hypothetical protein